MNALITGLKLSSKIVNIFFITFDGGFVGLSISLDPGLPLRCNPHLNGQLFLCQPANLVLILSSNLILSLFRLSFSVLTKIGDLDSHCLDLGLSFDYLFPIADLDILYLGSKHTDLFLFVLDFFPKSAISSLYLNPKPSNFLIFISQLFPKSRLHTP